MEEKNRENNYFLLNEDIQLTLFRIYSVFFIKEFWTMSISGKQPNQSTEMKIADSVLLSLFMRDTEKCNISHRLKRD